MDFFYIIDNRGFMSNIHFYAYEDTEDDNMTRDGRNQSYVKGLMNIIVSMKSTNYNCVIVDGLDEVYGSDDSIVLIGNN